MKTKKKFREGVEKVELEITALITWAIILFIIAGVPFIKADGEERFLIVLLSALSTLIFMKKLMLK